MKRIYLDHNASTPIDSRVLKVLIEELQEEEGNPSSAHFHGRACRSKLEKSRASIARTFGVKPNEIIFTSGGTEGANLLIRGMMPSASRGHIVTSNAQHACVNQVLLDLEKSGVEVTFLAAGEKGSVNPGDVERAIRPDTCFIALTAVNNETGVMTDLESIGEIAERFHIPLVIDAVAWLGKEKIWIPSSQSALFFSGHKVHAPKGIGFCICPQSIRLNPLFRGGGQEFQRRPGTENLPGIIALAEAIAVLEESQAEITDHMRNLRESFEARLMSGLPDVCVNGTGTRTCNTSNLAFLGVDGESLLVNLDMEGISVSHGSACSTGVLEPSRILLEMGIPLQRVMSSIRFSFSRMTTEDEIQSVADTMIRIVKKMRSI